jgi:hypothetical protein
VLKWGLNVRFSVGVNYLTQTDDVAEVRDDFAQIASLGLDTLRLFVRWDDPDVELARCEKLVACAAEAGLQTLPSLTCGDGIGNIYSGPLLDAQVAFATTIGERLRAHPAIRAWDIGHAFTSVSPPARGKITSGEHASEPIAERTVAAWSRRLADALKAASARPTTVGTTSDDLTHDNNIRLGSLCAPLAFASMQGSNISLDVARDRLDRETLPFLAMLTAAFSYKPVLVTGFGNPEYPYFTADENAAYCSDVLERLHADGRLGAYWWTWTGADSAVAAALSGFARQAREVVKPNDMPMISSTYYYRTLPESTRTLFEAFLGFVDERRRLLS